MTHHLPKDSAADFTAGGNYMEVRRRRRRVTWTRFHLSREQAWPRWPAAAAGDAESDVATYLGPLAGVEGCEKVWLGRQVEDPEEAAFIILWESAPTLELFEASPSCGEFLWGLGCKAEEDDNDPPLLVSFQWGVGFWFPDDLHGRVTRTTIVIPYTGGHPEYKAWWREINTAFSGVLPGDIAWSLPRPFQIHSCAWVDAEKRALALRDLAAGQEQEEEKEEEEEAQPSAAATTTTGRGEVHEQPGVHVDVGDHREEEKAIIYYFLRWNGNNACLEWEEFAAKDPETTRSWDEKLAKAKAPISFWKRERWDIEPAPCYPVEPDGEEEEEEEEEE